MSSFTQLTYSCTGQHAPGKRNKSTRRVPIIGFIVAMLMMFNTASSQIIAESGIINEICPSCTSGDVRIEKVLLVDAAGVPVTASCTPGALMSNLYLQFNLNVISQERYGFLITGDLYVNNQFIKKINQCYAQTFSQGRTSVRINEPLTFSCGQPIEIRNAFTAWSQSAPTTPGVYEVCNRYNAATNTYDCAALSPKCYQYPYNIRVVGPLVSDFSYTSDCTGTAGVQTVQFSDKTTGGELAYSYAWDFGDGTTSSSASPLKTYAAAGAYVVTLKITDGLGQVNSRTQNVQVGRCCSFSVTAPSSRNLGNFSCADFNTIPALPSSLDQLKAAPYNIGMGAFPCGTLRFTVSDNANAVQCSASEQNISRTIMIYDDQNNNGIKEGSEPSETVIYNFSIRSSVPSAPSATGATRCGAGSVVLTATGIGVLKWYDQNGNLVGTGSSFETPSISETTTFFVSAMDCCESAKTPVVATVNAAAVVTLSGNSNICAGGSSTLTATGGSSYLWSNGATTSSITVSPAETTVYSVEVSTAEGCKDSKSMTVTVNPMPVINIGGNAVICFGGSTVLTASGGTSYKWSTGAITASVEISPAATTTYTVEVETAAGCRSSKSVTVFVNDKPDVEIIGNKEICAGEETTLTASGGASFAWSTGETTQAITVKPGTTTTYNVVVTSGANCQAEKSVQVIVNPLPVVTISESKAICKGDRITLAATGGTSYKWNTGATTSSIEVAPEQTSTYSVEVFSAKGCSSIASTTVTVNPLPVVNIAGETTICFGGVTMLTASGGSEYKWSNGATTASIEVEPAATTTYHVEVISDKGCVSSGSVTVTVNPLPVVNIEGNTTICFGGNTVLTASGGASYKWSNGASTASILVDPKETTEYTVEVTTDKGCVASSSVKVIVNSLPEISVTGNTVICYGGSTTLTATGGSEYVWSNGATTSSITVEPAATTEYTVTVTTDKGCVDSRKLTVVVNDKPVINITGTTEICFGQETTLTASGGASFKWSTGETTASIRVKPNSTSIYNVEVISGDNCRDNKNVEVIVNALPEARLTESREICLGEKITLNASGGDSYRWLNINRSESAIEVSPKETTEYTVEVSSAKGCISTRKMKLTVNALPEVKVEGERSVCYGLSTTLTASGGATYNWSQGSDANAVTVSPRANTTYTVEVISDKGCSVKQEVAVAVQNCGNFCTYTQYSFGTHYENERYIRDNNCVTDKSEATIEYAISKWPGSNIRIGEGRLNIRAGDAKWVIAFLPHAGQSTPMNSYPNMERLASDASVKNNLLAQTIVLAINMGLNEPLKYFSLKGGYMRTEGLADCGINGNRDGRISHFFIDQKGLADVDGEPGITVNDVYMIANMYLAGKTYNNFNIHTVSDIVETLNKAFEGCRSFKDFTDKAPEIGGKANYLKVYPNPFVSFVNFEFVSPEAGTAEVEIWDMAGRLVTKSTLGNVAAQEKTTYRLSTNNLSYGQYIYRLKVGNWMEQGKLIRFR